MSTALIRLFALRTVSLKRLAFLGFLLALLAYVSPPAEWLMRIADDPEEARHGFALQTMWSGCLWLLIPLLLLHAAHLPNSWRGIESGWIASRPNARNKVVLSSWLGTSLGAAALVAVVFVGAELGAGKVADSQPWKHGGELVGPRRGIVPADGLQWILTPQEESQPLRIRIKVALAPGESPFATALFHAARGASEASASIDLIARGQLELELPAGTGPIHCDLIQVGTGATLVVRDRQVELFVPATSRYEASLAICVHVLLTLVALIAVALGLGSFFRTGYAYALLASGWLGFWLRAGDSSWLPGSALPTLLSALHEGRAPSFPPLQTWLGSAGSAACGMFLCWARVRSERGRPGGQR